MTGKKYRWGVCSELHLLKCLWYSIKNGKTQVKRYKRWGRTWQPTPVFLPGKSHGWRRLEGYTPWGCKRVGHDSVREGEDRGWDGWMASPTRWTWVWVNSGSWWWTGRPGVLRFMGSTRSRTRLSDWTELSLVTKQQQFQHSQGHLCIDFTTINSAQLLEACH